MDNIRLLTEKILVNAAKDDGGHCYPSQIVNNKSEIAQALNLLEMYGTTYPMARGAMPIFTINELGKHFASTAAWSGKERAERLAKEQYKEQMEEQKTNNRLVKKSMVIAIAMGLLSILATFLIALFL